MTTSDDKNLPLPLAPHGYCKVIYAKNIFDITDRDEFLHPIEDGEQLTDVLPNWEPETITATLNGEVLSRELWESRKIKSGDSVIVVRTPAGDDAKDILRLVLLIVVVIYAPQFAGAFGAEGTFGYAVAYVGFVVAGSLLINAILPPTMPDMADDGLDSSRSYGIDGAKNTAEEGIPMPICYGGFRMAGNIISLYTKNAGNTQYLYMLLNAGEGHVAGIRDIEINEQALTSYQHVETITKLGSETQEIIPWFGDTTTPIAVGATINSTFQTRTTGTIDAFRIDVVAPGGLIQYTDQGEKRTVTVPLEIEYKLTTDTEWTSMGTWGGPTSSYGTRNVYHGYNSYDTDGNVTSYTDRELRTDFRDAGDYYDGRTIRNISGEPVGYYDEREYDIIYRNPEVSGKRTSAIRTSFFSPKLPQGAYDVRVRRTTADSTDPQIVDNLTWSDLNEIIFDDVTYPYTALVAMKVKLTDQISSLPNITYYNEGKVIRAWNSTTDVWYDTPSQNPAWISLDMLTNTRYGAGISDSRIDIDRWRDWADYCDTKGLTFQGVFDTEMNVWDALNYVTRAGHAKVIRVGTKYSLAIDRETAPTQLFTVGNIIKDSFAQNWMSIIDRANEIEVQYFDQNDRNKRRTIKLYDDAIATGEVIKSSKVTAWGVTDPDKAAKEGVYMLKNNRYIRSTVTFKAPLEAIAVTIGDVFLLQHEQPDWSGGGRLAAGSTTTTLEIDRPFTFDGAKSYTALVRFDSLSRYTAQITAITVGGRKLTLGAGFSGQTDIDRLTFGGIDIPITRIEADAVWVEDSTGLSVTDTVTLVQTDAIQTVGVTAGTSGTLTSVPLQATLPATPAEYAPWAIGENTTVTSKWRVTRVDVHEDLTATINGAEYNEAIYDWTLTDAVIAPPSDSDRIVPHVQNLSVAEGFLAIGGVNRPTVEIGWTIDEDFEDYGGAEIQISYDGDAYTTVKTLTDGSTWTWVEVNGGDDLVIKVVAMSSDGRFALRSTAPTQAITISGDPYGPTDVANFTIVAAAVGIALSWDANTTDNDYAGIDIKRNTTNDEPGALLLFTSDANQTSYVDVGATDTNSSYYYWARSIDTFGNTGSWVASTPTNVTPNTIADGVDGTTAWLTNPSATIPADADGSNPDFTGTNGLFKVYKGINDISSTCTFSVFAADNATVTINTADNTPVAGQPRGYYEVTGESVAQDVHSITLRAVTVDAITIDQTFTVTKSLAGIDATAKAVQLSTSSYTIAYDNSSGTPSLIGPSTISLTVNEQNTTGSTTWEAWDHTGAAITPVTNLLSGVTDSGATITEAAFAGITNNNFVRVRATREGIFDEISVHELLSGENGTIGNDAALIAVGANSRTIYREAFEFGIPVTYMPASINFTANRQNITGGTTWRIYDDTGAELTPTSSYLFSMTDTSATFTSSQIVSITNNDFIRVTATADGLTDEITIVSLFSAVHGVATYLSNETHVVEAEPDGSGTDLSGFSGTHVVRQGYSNRTTDATHSVVGTATNDGLTLQVGATTGIYSFTGTWGTANDSYTWTLRAAFGGNNYDRELTITKSKKGAPGEASVVSYLTNEVHVVATANDGSGADLSSGADGGTHVVRDGLTDVTTSAVHSIVGGTDNGTNWTKTQNGMTMTVQEGTGAYDLSGTWTTATDTETFTLRATYGGNDYDKVYSISKSKTGGDGTSPEVVTLSAEGNAFSYDNASGSPILVGPTSITLTVNEQNTVGATTWEAWDDTGAVISPIGNLLTSITDASAVILESSFAGITNNDWVKVRATRDGVSDEVTIYKLSSGQDGAAGWNTATLMAYKRLSTQPVDNPGSLTYTFASAGWTPANGWLKDIPAGPSADPVWMVAATAYSQSATDLIDALEWSDPPIRLLEDGTDGVDPIVGTLTNEAHVVATLADGTGYSYTNAGGTFMMWEGATDVTGAGPTYSIVGGTDQGTTWTKEQTGLTMTINETTGVYSLSGTWTSDEESFTLRAIYSTVTIDRVYTISKSKTGQTGEAAKSLRVTSTGNLFLYTGFWDIIVPETISFTASQFGSTNTVSWKTQEWNGSAWVDTATNRMNPTTGLSSVLNRIGFEAENEDSLRVIASFTDGGTYEDSQTIYKTRLGADAVVAYLTNETHTVAAAFDGTGYSYTNAGGTMKCQEGSTDKTVDALTSYSIVGGTDQGATWTKNQTGLIMTINETTGVYSLSGTWTSDAETFTLRCTRRGIDYDREYTIAKSKAGVDGDNAILLSISSDAQNFRYDTDGTLIAPSTINFTADQQGSTNTVSWKTQEWVTNAWVDTATNRMSPTTGLTSALSEANFAAEAEDSLRVVASFTDGATYTDSISVVKIGDGAEGPTGPGGANVANVFVYQRTNSATAPAKPTGTATYTFSTGAITNLDPLWSDTIPAFSADNRWLWVTTATASSTTATDDIAGGPSGDWATVQELSIIAADVTTGLLTNESHTVATASDGTGASYTGAGGTFKMWSGETEVTGSGPVYTIVGGTDQGATWTKNQTGLIMTINETTGVYSLSGTWTSDEESFTLRATYDGIEIDRIYSISKSKAGADGGEGTAAILLTVEADAQVFKYDANNTLVGPTSIGFTATQQNSSATVNWKTQYDNAGTWTDTATNRMSPTTGLTSTLTAANFAAEGDEVLRVVATMTDGSTYSDSVSILRVKDGAGGSPGSQGDSVATVYVYQRTQAKTAPALPGSCTYTFSNGNLTGTLNGWTTSAPDITGDKPFLWVTHGTAQSNTTTDLITSWATATVITHRVKGQALITDVDWVLTPTDPMGAWDMSAGTVGNTTMHNDIVGPYGEYPLVMQIAGNGTSPGWYSTWRHYHEFDKDKSYIYYVWVQRRSTDTNQGLYFGFPSQSPAIVASSTTGTANTNPYFVSNVGSQLTVGRWYLAVGVIHPDGSLVGDTGVAGIYDPYDYSQVYGGAEFE